MPIPFTNTISPHRQDADRAEWRVRLDASARIVLVFDMVGMDWAGFWEDTGRWRRGRSAPPPR